MDIGIPKERTSSEFRVGLPPVGVRLLTELGHTCYVETHAGVGSGFTDDEYQSAGATIVFSGEEAYGRADLVLKVVRPSPGEIDWLREGQTIMGLLHLGAAHPSELLRLADRRITAIAFERIQESGGTFPVLRPLSQIGGRMAAQLAAHLLQNDSGSRGVLLGGIPGVPPAQTVIIGAGTVGRNAAITLLGLGARVTLMDVDLARLQKLEDWLPGRAETVLSTPLAIEETCRSADVIVGAVRRPGERAPIVLRRSTIKSLRPGTVFIDLSIDEGGCAETSRPTTHTQPTFVEEGVVHCCIPNLPGAVAQTSTHAFHNAAWPYIKQVVDGGVEVSLEADPALKAALVIHNGKVVDEHRANNMSLAGQMS
jgi:alanine dehydrogenase